VHWGAALGSALYMMSRKPETKPISPSSSRNKITLPTKPLATFARLDLDDETDGEALQTA
jgi:hypothetical protein